MAKTLEKTLRTLDPWQRIKVGTQRGTGFFYVGSAGDLLDYGSGYDLVCYQNVQKIKNSAEKRLNAALENYPSLKLFAETELRTGNPKLSYDRYLEVVNAWFKQIERMSESLKRKQDRLGKFVHLPDRLVVEEALCDPASDYGVYRIVIEGNESGPYWLSSEPEKKPACSFLRSDNNAIDKSDEEEDEE